LTYTPNFLEADGVLNGLFNETSLPLYLAIESFYTISVNGKASKSSPVCPSD